MNAASVTLDILKYVLPSLVVLIAATTIVGRFLSSANQQKQIENFGAAQDITLRLRLQAYERLALFLERVSIGQLIPRVYDSSMTVQDLRFAITHTVRAEYEHNLSQQIYVSDSVWQTVKSAKEQEMAMVNRISETLDPAAPARDLHMRLLEVIAHANTDLPTESALQIVNEEVKKVMQYGSY